MTCKVAQKLFKIYKGRSDNVDKSGHLKWKDLSEHYYISTISWRDSNRNLWVPVIERCFGQILSQCASRRLRHCYQLRVLIDLNTKYTIHKHFGFDAGAIILKYIGPTICGFKCMSNIKDYYRNKYDDY